MEATDKNFKQNKRAEDRSQPKIKKLQTEGNAYTMRSLTDNLIEDEKSSIPEFNQVTSI